MRTVKIELLTTDAFLPFGFFGKLIDPVSATPRPVGFYPDIVQQNLGQTGIVSFSTCRVEKRDRIIDVSEYHTSCGEGILPLDNDILIHVGPATNPKAPLPADRIRVFRVPKGTMVTLRPGVWHCAPFTVNDQPANVLVSLPERTYANDCVFVRHSEEDRIAIVE
jgi:ureidoglycolate lyase